MIVKARAGTKRTARSTLFPTHTLAIARVRAALTVAGQRTGSQIARFDVAGTELTAKITTGDRTTTLRPDALITLTEPKRPQGKNTLHFFLEADRSTMHHDKMARKFRSYEAMRRANLHRDYYGLDLFRVLVVTKSQARAATLVDLIAGNRLHLKDPDQMRKLSYITAETNFADQPENIAAEIWTPGHGPTEHAAIVPQPLPRR